MCGGPPGSQMKMTEVSRRAWGWVAAIALNRNASAMLMPSMDNPPKRRKLRRETGPGQKLLGGNMWVVVRAEGGRCFEWEVQAGERQPVEAIPQGGVRGQKNRSYGAYKTHRTYRRSLP